MNNKYVCKPCNFETHKLYNYNKHCESKKHMRISATKNVSIKDSRVSFKDSGLSKNDSKNATKREKSYFYCQYCEKKISHANNKNRHLQTCKMKPIIELEHDILITENTLENELENLREKMKALEEEKVNIAKTYEEQLENEKKEKEEITKEKDEIAKEKDEITREMIDFMKQVANNEGGPKMIINNNGKGSSGNMFFVINNFPNAPNYEEIMAPPLTDEEIDQLYGLDPKYGCRRLLIERCVKNRELEDRPFHCVDESRNKILLKTEGSWQVDPEGKKIMEHILPLLREYYLKPEYEKRDLFEFNEIRGKMIEMELTPSQVINFVGSKTNLKNALRRDKKKKRINIIKQ